MSRAYVPKTTHSYDPVTKQKTSLLMFWVMMNVENIHPSFYGNGRKRWTTYTAHGKVVSSALTALSKRKWLKMIYREGNVELRPPKIALTDLGKAELERWPQYVMLAAMKVKP